MATVDSKLSRSMEDYLEAIYNLQLRGTSARVSDIAAALGVKMPSVTGAIKSLSDRGLVLHKPYEEVELTEDGLRNAREIAHRHSAVKEFLVKTLGLAEEDAESEACSLEHAITSDTLDRLIRFVDFSQACETDKSLSLRDFRRYLTHGVYPGGDRPRRGAGLGRYRAGVGRPVITSTKLSDLSPGTQARIAFVTGRGPIRRRLMEMGLTPDTSIQVVRAAPLGDPIEVKVRGYSLSLRKCEAELVEVEIE